MNERLLKQSNDRIKGRENDPAEQVFKNIQIPWLKTVPAGLFLRIMNGGYSRALGVSCTHCHVEEDFSSDEQAAEARRPRDGKNAPDDQRATGKNGKPRSAGD